MKLDVGCARNKSQGAIGIDIRKDSDADIICDLERTLPFEDDVFDEVYCNHVVEHIADLINLMEEIHRVSKSHAKVFIGAPYYACVAAFSDPTHKRFITESAFKYFTRSGGSFDTSARFKMLKISYKYHMIPKIFFFIPKIIFRRLLFNSTYNISFHLEVIK